MDNHANQFRSLVEQAKVILITGHISPDPDAVCSTLLLGTALQKNFPDKQSMMVLEEEPSEDLSYLEGYENIKFENLLERTHEFKPDLFIMVDAMNFERISRNEGKELRKLVRDTLKSKLVIIDHHTDIGLEASDLYINNQEPATAVEIYQLLFRHLKLDKPPGYAPTTLLGIITDTKRFLYRDRHHRQTFEIVSELIDAGASIEQLDNRLNRYSVEQMRVFSNLAKNVVDSGQGYTYSYIDDEVAVSLPEDSDAIKMAGEMFTNHYIRNIESNQWGFVVYPEEVDGNSRYSVSFRAANNVKDVAEIAGKLGGGGHKSASGAKGIMASDALSAARFVQSVVEDPALKT